jgi:Na+-translocating ferredoxin:NAD+ oxidoreductase RNF subunit RnfB
LINLTKQAHLKQHTINRCIEGRYAVVADLSSIFSDFDTNEHKKYITKKCSAKDNNNKSVFYISAAANMGA